MFSCANYSFLRNTHCGSIFLHVRIERTIGERQRRNMLVLLRRVCGHEVRLPPGLRGVDTASRVNAYKASLLCSDTCIRTVIRSKRRADTKVEKVRYIEGRRLIARLLRDGTLRHDAMALADFVFPGFYTCCSYRVIMDLNIVWKHW